MTEMSLTDGAAAPGGIVDPDNPPGLHIVAQYVKDLSFENLNAPQSLMPAPGAANPNIEVNANIEAQGKAQDLVEVELSLTVTATRGEEKLFLAEVVYAALFRIRAPNHDSLHEICMVECPRLLFPFARRVIADLTRDGGYTPLLLDPIDFQRLFRDRMAQAAAEGQPQN